MIRARLSVFSSTLCPDDLVQRLTMQGDGIWKAGEPFPGRGLIAGRLRKENCWWIESSLVPTEGVADEEVGQVIKSVLERVEGKELMFQALQAAGCEIEFALTSIERRVPALHFAPSILAEIASLGADLDIDIMLADDD